MHIYEYLFAAIIIITMVTASAFMIDTLSEPHVKISEREQLKITAEKIMNQILFDPGNPIDWGSNPNVPIQNLQSFGLAKYNETTRGAYVLDSDKILRLSYETNKDPNVRQKITNLLNLHDYGIALELTTPLMINANHNPNTNTYNMTVTSQLGGLPIFNAKINARLYYINNGQIESQEKNSLTDILGKCLLDFGSLPSKAKTLVIVANYFNIHTVKVVSDKLTNMFGNQIFSSEPLINEKAYQAIVTKEKGSYIIKNVESTLTDQGTGWYQISGPEPSMLATLAVTDQGVVSASKDVSEATYISISVDFDELVNPLSYSIERTVTINDQTYLMTLYVWRMSY